MARTGTPGKRSPIGIIAVVVVASAVAAVATWYFWLRNTPGKVVVEMTTATRAGDGAAARSRGDGPSPGTLHVTRPEGTTEQLRFHSGWAAIKDGYLSLLLCTYPDAARPEQENGVPIPPEGHLALRIMLQGVGDDFEPGTYRPDQWEKRQLWPKGTLVFFLEDGREGVTGTSFRHRLNGEAGFEIFGFNGDSYGTVTISDCGERVVGSFDLATADIPFFDEFTRWAMSGEFDLPLDG